MLDIAVPPVGRRAGAIEVDTAQTMPERALPAPDHGDTQLGATPAPPKRHPHVTGWLLALDALACYTARERHTDVPPSHIEELDGTAVELGAWFLPPQLSWGRRTVRPLFARWRLAAASLAAATAAAAGLTLPGSAQQAPAAPIIIIQGGPFPVGNLLNYANSDLESAGFNWAADS